jgi:hypothetical protein
MKLEIIEKQSVNSEVVFVSTKYHATTYIME